MVAVGLIQAGWERGFGVYSWSMIRMMLSDDVGLPRGHRRSTSESISRGSNSIWIYRLYAILNVAKWLASRKRERMWRWIYGWRTSNMSSWLWCKIIMILHSVLPWLQEHISMVHFVGNIMRSVDAEALSLSSQTPWCISGVAFLSIICFHPWY